MSFLSAPVWLGRGDLFLGPSGRAWSEELRGPGLCPPSLWGSSLTGGGDVTGKPSCSETAVLTSSPEVHRQRRSLGGLSTPGPPAARRAGQRRSPVRL